MVPPPCKTLLYDWLINHSWLHSSAFPVQICRTTIMREVPHGINSSMGVGGTNKGRPAFCVILRRGAKVMFFLFCANDSFGHLGVWRHQSISV